MAKATKKHPLKQLNRQDVLAVFFGLVLLHVGGALLSLLLHVFSNAVYGNLHFSQLWSPRILSQAHNAGYFYGNIFMVLFGLQLLFYVFVGWFVMRRAHSRAWYVAAIPSLLVFFGALISFLLGDLTYPSLMLNPAGTLVTSLTQFSSQVGSVLSKMFGLYLYGFLICGLLTLSSVLGGLAARHLKVK